MKCPVDQVVLEISNRNNIEIDYCPTCRGVWLDRGELDKIIERSENTMPNVAPHQDASRRQRRPYEDDNYGHNNGRYPKKKRESFFGDLFDF